ncbi:MAG: hypothetical protein AUI17_07315 [Acidobacteriales bacterium 13_2_20CM_2_55_5]|nr:MAG: hypothetical protein AUI17_07315 [Acidobacteriales bacterium 13_2_20CM_2_55_5]
MKSSARITAIASIALVICMMSTVLLLRKLDQLRTGSAVEEVLYISSPSVLKRISLGYVDCSPTSIGRARFSILAASITTALSITRCSLLC